MENSVAVIEIREIEELVDVHFAINEFLHVLDEDRPGHFISLVAVEDTHV